MKIKVNLRNHFSVTSLGNIKTHFENEFTDLVNLFKPACIAHRNLVAIWKRGCHFDSHR